MDPIYVTGHRNPDTDSIVAAMAYAALRNAVGDREYEAACLGHVSDETHTVLKRCGFQPPKRITSMFTQVRDLDYDTPPVLSAAVTVGRAWKNLQSQKNISAIPVINEDGTLEKIGYSRTARHPRNFMITPDGGLMLVACRDDKVIQVFRISEDGTLTLTPSVLRFESDMPSSVTVSR